MIDKKLFKRFTCERAEELERRFYDMPFEEAERVLKEKGIITDTGFIVKEDMFGGEVVPFEKALLFLYIPAVNEVGLYIVLYTADGEEPKTKYELDCAMLNFLLVKDTNLKDNESLKLLKENKREFVKTLSAYHRIFKWDFR